MGAKREVPMPPETLTGVVRPLLCQSLQALGPPRGDVAVGHERAVAGDAQLAAVGVAGEEQVRAVLGEVVQHALVGGMDDGHAEVRRSLSWSRVPRGQPA